MRRSLSLSGGNLTTPAEAETTLKNKWAERVSLANSMAGLAVQDQTKTEGATQEKGKKPQRGTNAEES